MLPLHQGDNNLERMAGIEPATCPWQGYVLPLAPHPQLTWLPRVGSNHRPTD